MQRRKSDTGSRVTLPITPMLDMTFQLLFFFIVNFHPADLEGEMTLSLPADEALEQLVAQPGRPAPDEFPIDLTVKVRTQLNGIDDGEISAVFVRNLEGREEPVDGLAGLKKFLNDKREDLTNKEAIKVQGDGKLKVRSVLKVMDVCRRAGFANVSFVSPEELGR